MWCWRRLLNILWTARSDQSILKEINPEYLLEGLMLKLKLQYFGYLMWRAGWFTRKDPDAGKDWRREEKGTTEDKRFGWHHRLNGHEFEQALGDGDGQGSLMCCSPWGHKELDMTEWLNNHLRASQVVLVVKSPPANEGDMRDVGSVPGFGRSSRGGHGNPLQYSCLKIPTDRGAW